MMDMFDFLPLVCIIDKKYFCVHGGISPKALDIDTIKKEKRNI
jgi:diadenosine tetraphosphatase ApaH/serine/threonine PP2A family protein phosphatase